MKKQQEITMVCDVPQHIYPSPRHIVLRFRVLTLLITPARRIFVCPTAAEAYDSLWRSAFTSAWKRNRIILDAMLAVIAVREPSLPEEHADILDTIPANHYLGFTFAVQDHNTASRIWIEEVMVHPAYRSRGIGTLLMGHMMWELNQEGIREAILTCNPNRRAGKRTLPEFYEQFGFRQQ